MNKPAVLLVEYATGKVDTFPGEKGDIYTSARDLIKEINDKGNPEGIARVIAFGVDGVLKDKKWKGITPAPVVAEKPAKKSEKAA